MGLKLAVSARNFPAVSYIPSPAPTKSPPPALVFPALVGIARHPSIGTESYRPCVRCIC